MPEIVRPTDDNAGDFSGRKIGDCEIIRKISEGGTADIYLARNTRVGKQRVLKILRPSLVDNLEFFVRFKREARFSAQLSHPNVLQVYDTGEVDGSFYIEMEYIRGDTLRSYLYSKDRLPEKEALQIAKQVASALDYAHSVTIDTRTGETTLGILHRDLKPENIMVMRDGAVKLMDFGAAKPLSVESFTAVGTIVGTFHYMSPEQVVGEELTPASDFFSFGVLLYEMLTGKHPFEQKNLNELLANLRSGTHTPVRVLYPEIGKATDELCERLLASDPHNRPANAAEIIEAIDGAMAGRRWRPRRGSMLLSFLRCLLWAVTIVVALVALALAILGFPHLR